MIQTISHRFNTVCVCVWGGGGGYSDMLIRTLARAIFWGFKILNFNFWGIFRKINIFWGMKILCFILGVIIKMDYIYGSFPCI